LVVVGVPTVQKSDGMEKQIQHPGRYQKPVCPVKTFHFFFLSCFFFLRMDVEVRCSKCNKPCQRAQAKKDGPNKGKYFWSCSTYNGGCGHFMGFIGGASSDVSVAPSAFPHASSSTSLASNVGAQTSSSSFGGPSLQEVTAQVKLLTERVFAIERALLQNAATQAPTQHFNQF